MHVGIAGKDKLIVERRFLSLKFAFDRFFFMESLFRKKSTAKKSCASCRLIKNLKIVAHTPKKVEVIVSTINQQIIEIVRVFLILTINGIDNGNKERRHPWPYCLPIDSLLIK